MASCKMLPHAEMSALFNSYKRKQQQQRHLTTLKTLRRKLVYRYELFADQAENTLHKDSCALTHTGTHTHTHTHTHGRTQARTHANTEIMILYCQYKA